MNGRDKMVDIPQNIRIHSDFLKELLKDEFERAFRYLWDLFDQIYAEIPKSIQLKPLYLFIKAGELHSGEIHVFEPELNSEHRKNANDILIPVLINYGFVFNGLNKNKVVPKTRSFIISYPDDPTVVKVLYLVYKKAQTVSDVYTINRDLLRQWNYRLLEDGFGIYNYKDVYINLFDLLHHDNEKLFLKSFNEAVLKIGLFTEHFPGRRPEHVSYFKNTIRKPFIFDVRYYGGKNLKVALRIRNAQKCTSYLEKCPEHIKNKFRTSVVYNPDCVNLFRYVFEGNEVIKCCGCCGEDAGFILNAVIEDIPHYIRLVELGVKK